MLQRRFFETLLSWLWHTQVDLGLLTAPILPSTRRLIIEGNRLFSSSSSAEVCGALLDQEWRAYSQLANIYEDMRNHMLLFELEEFHETYKYFYLHIGATEKEHKVHSLSTAAKICRDEGDYLQLENGFTGYLNLLAVNWDEIYKEINVA